MRKQLTRTDYLKITGLPDWETFELSPDRHPHDGRWMIKARAAGHLDHLVEPAGVEHYLDCIRETAPDLASQIDTCLEELRRRADDRE